MEDSFTKIIDYIDEALLGEWRVLLYDMPFHYSVRGFGIAAECAPDYFERLGIPQRVIALGGKMKYVGRSKSPENWSLFKFRPSNRKQLRKVTEHVEGKYPLMIERGTRYWEWLQELPKDAREKITGRGDFTPRTVIEWEEVK